MLQSNDLHVTIYSIIVPIYNTADYLIKCLDSILCQTYRNFELILVDDGSSDRSPVICDDYSRQDSRIKVIHKENGGLSDARNAGIEVAKGDYIIFVDSDDYWDGIGCLTSINDAAQDNPDIVLYRAKKLYESSGKIKCDRKNFKHIINNNFSDRDILRELVDKDLFRCSACTKAVRAKILLDNKIYFQRGVLGEDIAWYLNTVLKSNKFSFVDSDFYVYRQREGSITKSFGIKNIEDLLNIVGSLAVNIGNHVDDEYKKTILLKYLAKEYSNLYIVYALVSGKSKKKYRDKIQSLSWLFNYSTVKRTSIIKFLYNTFGFDGAVLAIKIVSTIKKRT